MDDSTRRDKPRWLTVLAVVAMALVIRAVVVAAMSGSLSDDPDAYRRLAEHLRTTGVYSTTDEPTAFRPPLYPLLLAALAIGGKVSPAAVGVLHVVLGAATVVLTYYLAEQWKLRRWSLVACGLVAIDPILLAQSTLVMTETLATCLAAAGLLALTLLSRRPTPRTAAFCGVLLALAALCRPTFLPWLGLSGAAIGLRAAADRSRFKLTAVYFAVAAVVLSPWMLRNYLVLGAAKVTTTHGGYTLLLGNNPSFYDYLRDADDEGTWDAKELADAWAWRRFSTSPRDAMWDLPAAADAIPRQASVTRTEIEDDRFAYALARRYIADQPGMFAYSCFVRVCRLWQLIPYKRTPSELTIVILLRLLIGAWYFFLLTLAVIGLAVRRREILRPPLVWGVLLAATFTAVHAFY